MLNIHSFLLGKLKTYGTSICLTAITFAFITIVLSTDCSYDAENRTSITYVKAETIQKAFRGVEGTEKDATIQLNNNGTERRFALGEVIQNAEVIESEQKVKTEYLRGMAENQAIREQESKEKMAIRKAEKEAAKKEAAKKKAIEEKIAKKEAAKKKAAEEKEAKRKAAQVILSSEDKAVLERIVEAEATGEDIKGKMLVANVVLNRVKNNSFPNSVSGVVFQKNGSTYQFSPIKDRRYWSVRVSKDTKAAVKRVLEGENESQGALFFSARSKADKRSMNWFDTHLTWLFKYGEHEFYK